jgi:hypothetical protein
VTNEEDWVTETLKSVECSSVPGVRVVSADVIEVRRQLGIVFNKVGVVRLRRNAAKKLE